MARAICLIVLPCIIYIACFQIHFGLLTLSGSGTSFMSPEFQTSLQGINFPKASPSGKKVPIYSCIAAIDAGS